MNILLTGGSANGKSTYAESICVRLPGPRYYIAAMRPYGSESQKKIERHRIMRADKGFETFERYTDLKGLVLPEKGTVLLECMCNLTANEMFDDLGNMRDPSSDIIEGIENLKKQSRDLIVVTNDVGGDIYGYSDSTMEYMRVLGRLNAYLANDFDTVIEVVAGIPLPVKGEII